MSNLARLYRILTWLFVVGVVLQVFLAGLVVVARQSDWEAHIGLGHMLGMPLILMLIFMYVGKASSTVKRTTWILLLVYVIQADVIIFMRGNVPLISAFHPVLALIDFWLGMRLLRETTGGAGFAAKAA
ncbi:MAG: DUF6220 domain-containing protein [Anaerolineales bacterium]